MKKALLALTLVLIACRREHVVPRARAQPPAAPLPPNIARLMDGAGVVSRTAEATLDNSAVRLIDGDGRTAWLSPPEDGAQSVTFALRGAARIDRVGIITTARTALAPKSVRFELSDDGVRFRAVGTFPTKASGDTQLFPIAPSTASYVRLATLEAARTLQVNEVWVSGTFSGPSPEASFNGCWSINGWPAVLKQQGAAVSGFAGGMLGTAIEGGTDGRFCRVAWIRGPEYGLAALTVAGNPPHLSGIVWHEEAIQMMKFLAPDWLGDQAPCPAEPLAAPPDVFRAFVERLHYFPLYGLRFDEGGRLLEVESAATLDRVTGFLAANPSLAVRFRSHELTRTTARENRAVAQRKADTLRAALQRRGTPLGHVEFVILGAEQPRRDVDADITRAMYSSIELEVAR